jgi:hypothetical protein
VWFPFLTYLIRSSTIQNILKVSKLFCTSFFRQQRLLIFFFTFLSKQRSSLSCLYRQFIFFSTVIHNRSSLNKIVVMILTTVLLSIRLLSWFSQPFFCCPDSLNRSSLDESTVAILAIGLLWTRLLPWILQLIFSRWGCCHDPRSVFSRRDYCRDFCHRSSLDEIAVMIPMTNLFSTSNYSVTIK